MKDKENIELEMVNIDKFSVQKKTVSVNGKTLPLSIGDKIKLSENDKNAKTVVGISVYEDGRASYMLEWYDSDSGQFNTEAVTLTELKLLSKKTVQKMKNNIGFK